MKFIYGLPSTPDLRTQCMSSKLVNLVIEKFYKVETQEALSTLRTLHALHGLHIEDAMKEFLRSTEGTNLPRPARNELLRLVGAWVVYSGDTPKKHN